MSNLKPTNPKDALGIAKPPLSTVPITVVAEVGVAMMEGARKYGRHNYRAPKLGVRASVYFDATFRHIGKWWEGEDIDADSGLSHITKAIASLIVLRDAIIRDNWTDDRPPKSPADFFLHLETSCKSVIEKYPDSLPPWTAFPPKRESFLLGNDHTDDCIAHLPVGGKQERAAAYERGLSEKETRSIAHHPVCTCTACAKGTEGLH